MKTALVAGVPNTAELFGKALQSKFACVNCLSLEQVRQNGFQDIDFILAEVSFDHGRLPALLQLWKSHPASSLIPFIVIHATEQPWPLLEQSIAQAKSLGAKGFVDAFEWRRELGDDAAAERIGMFVQSLVVFQGNTFRHIGETKAAYNFHRS